MLSLHVVVAALTMSAATSQMSAIIRRTDGRLEILDVDQMVAFVKDIDSQLSNVATIQVRE
jgi:hypothetical protein